MSSKLRFPKPNSIESKKEKLQRNLTGYLIRAVHGTKIRPTNKKKIAAPLSGRVDFARKSWWGGKRFVTLRSAAGEEFFRASGGTVDVMGRCQNVVTSRWWQLKHFWNFHP